ncbi:MAG: hypothetical protein JXR63_08995 [Spirochaetales bacterium]|nr:hypothetical protein [Spirochaetales bacterium]
MKKMFLTLLLVLSTVLLNANNVESFLDYSAKLDINGEKIFYDQGAHHGFGFPTQQIYAGAFRGPHLQSIRDKDLAKILILPEIFIDGKSSRITKKTDWTRLSPPGRLIQFYETQKIRFETELFYSDSRIAVISSKITNLTGEPVEIFIKLHGKSRQSTTLNDQSICVDLDSEQVWINASQDFAARNSIGGGFKFFSKEKRTLTPQQSYSFDYQVAYSYANSQEFTQTQLQENLANADQLNKQNHELWANRINKIETRITSPEWRIPAIKSLLILYSNWKAAAGDLKHDGIYPASHFFKAFWGWDSWKHAAALSFFDLELSLSNVVTMYDFMDENGFIPDNIFPDSSKNNLRDTKPPLSGWALELYLKNGGEADKVAKLYDKLLLQHNWWYKFRDHDGNQLCEYGSEDGTMQATRWESGWDNAARFDNRKIVKNKNGGYSADIESVDLNSYLYREKIAIAVIAEQIGKNEDAKRYREDAAKIKELINNLMFDQTAGFYCDIDLTTKKSIGTREASGWLPLWAGVADNEKAEKVKETILEEFNTTIPFSTLSPKDDRFMKGDSYWRGPVWIDQVYFGLSGLKRYGYDREAEILIDKILRNTEGLTDPSFSIYENYNPLTGKAMCASRFSWSAAHFLMIACDIWE